jgi:hypothetical protein
MYFKQLIVCMVIAFVCLAGCAPSGVQQGRSKKYEHFGRTDFETTDEYVKIFPSVREVSRYLAQDIENKFSTSNKSIVFGFFTTLEKKNRSLLCEQLEHFLRNYLNCKQSIDYETYQKLKKYWSTVGSYGLIQDESIKMFLNTAHCLVTGMLVLEKNRNIINILINGNDSLSGDKLFSTEAALDYSHPDIKRAWDTISAQSDNTIHENRTIPGMRRLELAQRSYQDKTLVGFGTGYGENELMAYQAAKVLCGLDFVTRYVPARIAEKTTIKDKEIASHIVKQNLKGWVPPGIDYEYKHQLEVPIKQLRPDRYEATVGGKLKQSRLDEWVQTQAVAAGLTLKNP